MITEQNACISADELRRIVRYDQKTGVFVRKITTSSNAKAGQIAGSESVYYGGKKYLSFFVNGVSYKAHRLAYLYITGSMPENEIDHINGDGTDNRWENLRRATHAENCKNMKLFSTNKSGHSGVRKELKRNKWQAQIYNKGKKIFLGGFDLMKDAIEARRAAEIKYGYHKNHGTERPL